MADERLTVLDLMWSMRDHDRSFGDDDLFTGAVRAPCDGPPRASRMFGLMPGSTSLTAHAKSSMPG
jgi:hypothetical protein